MKREASTSNLWLVAALLPLLGACESQYVGDVPEELIEIYDLAAPDGTIELEIDRAGHLIELEADVPISLVPATVLAAVEGRLPGAEILGAEREFNAGGRMWELKVMADGKKWEFVVDERGAIFETEEELSREEAPEAVLAAAEAAVPGATFVSVESVQRGGLSGPLEYHVKKSRDGGSYKVVLLEDGTVLRAVREARAEIEIPLEN